MPVTAGTRLGPYEIEAALGEGGMGEVYRARDTRLGRTVAIKILRGSLAADPVFTHRLENEARTLSRIAHPNICVLHDVGIGNPTYLVLEYLDGTTLADRIARGPLPLDEIRRLGAEICRALQTAHMAGIVHRDFKPGNVMLTKSGAKLLDFGIALEQRAVAGTDHTTVMSMTAPGAIMGTPAYMAPEQLNGMGADARSDIFALGVVLYEMATGRRAFPGETPTAVAAAILSFDPPAPSSMRPDLPAAFDAIVAGCLARDRDERWQSAHDVGRQLEGLASRRDPDPRGGVSRSRMAAAWTAAALAILAALAIGAWAWFKPSAQPPAPARVALKVTLPPGAVVRGGVEGNAIALSPDGSQLAWVGASADTGSQIWLRALSDVQARPLAGTDGAGSLFWSPDGRSIGFFAKGLLQRLDLNGAAPVVLCPVQGGVGYSGTWGDGRILFAAVQGDAILRVSTSGGTPEKAFAINRAAHQHRIGWPWFLPDGRSVLYFVRSEGSPTLGQVMLARGDGSTQHVTDVPTEVQYVEPGFLVFVLRGALVAQRFDAAAGRLSGDPLPLASTVGSFPPSGWAGFTTASRNGTIAFTAPPSDVRLAWIDSTGRARGYFGTPGNYLGVNDTPGGESILATRMDNATGVYDIWSLDITRGTESRVTSGPSTNLGPVTLPSGVSLIYSKSTGGAPELYQRHISSGAETPLAPGEGFQQSVSITRDGGTLVYLQRRQRGDWDVWRLPLNGAHTPSPVVATTFNESDARLSPDDSVVALASDETGHGEIYVAPFPEGAPRYRVSVAGGRTPRWTGTGRTLMFIADDGRLMRAEVTVDKGLRAAPPVPVFPEPLKVAWRDFLPLRGGRLLAIVPEAQPQEPGLTLITNAVR